MLNPRARARRDRRLAQGALLAGALTVVTLSVGQGPWFDQLRDQLPIIGEQPDAGVAVGQPLRVVDGLLLGRRTPAGEAPLTLPTTADPTSSGGRNGDGAETTLPPPPGPAGPQDEVEDAGPVDVAVPPAGGAIDGPTGPSEPGLQRQGPVSGLVDPPVRELTKTLDRTTRDATKPLTRPASDLVDGLTTQVDVLLGPG